MRDVMEYAVRCMDMLDSIGICCGNIIDVKINTRAKKRWGLCKLVPGGYEIEIAEILLDERNPDTGLMNTMLHELLHSVPGCMNHGAKWKSLAAQVSQRYGIEIKRCGSNEDKCLAAELVAEKMENYKYFVRCPDCGHVFKYMRLCDTVKNPQRYLHTGCHSKLERVFEL